METIARIGASIRIKGEVTAREPLTISGHVNGTIDVDGYALTVDPGGRVEACVTAHTIVIGGTVSGSLCADARIVIRETARIEGHVSAPAIILADGATVQGKIETAGRPVAVPLVAEASAV